MEEKERQDHFRLKRFKQLKEKHKRAAAIKLCHCCLKVFQDLNEKPLSLCPACAKALTKDIKRKQGQDVVMCRNDGTKLKEFLDTRTEEALKLTKDLRSHGLLSASMEQLVAPSNQINLNIINPQQIFKRIPVSSFAEKSRFYTCGRDKPFAGTCCIHKLVKYTEASSHLYLPLDQNLKMRSPALSQEEELIICDAEYIINIENIPIVTSTETQSVVVQSEQQYLEESATPFVDIALQSVIAPASSANLVTSEIRNRTLETLNTSTLLKQSSESYTMPQRLPYDDIVSLKPEVPHVMPQNLDAMENPVNEFVNSVSPYITEYYEVRPEISYVLRTPCIYHIDTETTSSVSSSTTKKSGSQKPVTQKYKKSVKIRTYRNPDGSVTEEKKIVERSSTLNKGNIDISDFNTSDEDETKFDDKYFDSLFKDIPNELDEDDFIVHNEKNTNRGSVSRQTKSEKIYTSEPMADVKLKTSISGKTLSSKAENASNDNNTSVSYVHLDIIRNRSMKEPLKENVEETIDQVSKKSSDETSISKKSEKINKRELIVDSQYKTSVSGETVSLNADTANNEYNSIGAYVHYDINRNRPVKEHPRESEKEIPSKIMYQISKKSSDEHRTSVSKESEKNHTNKQIVDSQYKTSISDETVNSKAESANNEHNSIGAYVHSDVKRNRQDKVYPKESDKEIQSKITDPVSKKSSDGASISRKSKSERINNSAPMADPQLKTSISGKVISSQTRIAIYEDNSIVSYVHSDIKGNHPVKELSKETEKEIQWEIMNQVSRASSSATIRSISINKKHNVVTRSTSADAIPIKNEATNTEIIFEKLNMKETQRSILKRNIREEFDNLITKRGRNPSQKDFDKFCKEMYDKYGIQVKDGQDESNERKKPLEQKLNRTEEIELKALKGLEKEQRILQEILNRIRSKTKDDVNEKRHIKEDSISKIEPKSNDANLSVKGSLEQYGKKLLNTVEYIKEGVKNIFSRESSKLSEIEKDKIKEPDDIKMQDFFFIESAEIKTEEHKKGDVKSQGIKILDSSQSENSIIKAVVGTFNKRGLQISDSEDDPKGVVQSAINKFNAELRRPGNITDNRVRKLEDTKTTYNENQTKLKEEEEKPTFVIKEIEIVDKQIPAKVTLESTTIQKELRAFRSSSHPDKTTTDSDITSKSAAIAKEQVATVDNNKKDVTMLNDMLITDKEKLAEKRMPARSELDKKSVSLPESEFSTESHLKSKHSRFKEKGGQEKFELHSVYKEASISSQVSEISKLASKQSSSIRKDDNVSVTKQEEGNVDSTMGLMEDKVQSDESGRKIIICKKCLMTLCGFIPSKIVEETEVSADCQLCRLKVKQKEPSILPNSNNSATAEETSFHSSDEEGQICATPVLPYKKCYDKETWSEAYPCGRPKEDQKLVIFCDASYNELEEEKVNDDVTKFVMTSSPCTSVPIKPDKLTISITLTEPSVATVPTEQSFAEMLAKSLKRLLGIQQNEQTLEIESCESDEIYDSCESEMFNTPCSPKICTREAATNTKISNRYDVRCLRDLPAFKKGAVKSDTESSKCVNSDMTLEITRKKDQLKIVSSSSLDNIFNRNKTTCTKTENSKNICKKNKK